MDINVPNLKALNVIVIYKCYRPTCMSYVMKIQNK